MSQFSLAWQLELLDALAVARSMSHNTTMQSPDLKVRAVVLVLPDHRTHGIGGGESAAASRDVGYGCALRCPGAAVEQRGSDAVVEQCGAPERPRALALPASMFDRRKWPSGEG
jgi:hypothetical protein